MSRRGRAGCRLLLIAHVACTDVTLALEVMQDFPGGFLGHHSARVNRDGRVARGLVGIADAGELLHDARTRFRVKSFAISLLAGFKRR